MTIRPGWTAPGTGQTHEPPTYPSAQGGYPTLPPASGGSQPGRPRTWPSHRGIVPIRPLVVGDLLNGALAVMRFNPGATLGLSLVVLSVVLSVALPITLLLSRAVQVDSAMDSLGLALPATVSVGTLPLSLGALVQIGLLSPVIKEAAIGRRISLSDAWTASLRGSLAFLGLLALAGIAIVAVLAAAGALSWQTEQPAFLVVAGLAVTAASFYLGLRLLFLPAAMVLEGVRGRAALARAWQLGRGRFWRTLGVMALTTVVAGVVGWVIELPISVVTSLLGLLSMGQSPTYAMLTAALGSVLASSASQVLLGPFRAGVVTLLYLDARIRSEGLDITLLEESSEGASL